MPNLGGTDVQFDWGKDLQYSGLAAHGLNGIVVGEKAIETIIHDTIFANIERNSITYTGSGGLMVHNNNFDNYADTQDPDKDTIHIYADASNFVITENAWRTPAYITYKPKYGINIATGASDHYTIAGNQFTQATFGTAFMNDGGTGSHKSLFISGNLTVGSGKEQRH